MPAHHFNTSRSHRLPPTVSLTVGELKQRHLDIAVPSFGSLQTRRRGTQGKQSAVVTHSYGRSRTQMPSAATPESQPRMPGIFEPMVDRITFGHDDDG